MESSTEKKYLKWYSKAGYGIGSLGLQFTCGIVNSFLMIYLTNIAGLEAGILGTLMMFARFADGVSDVFFGNLIDRTKTKMGKAKPWYFWSYFGNAATLIALFAIPTSWGNTAKYIYFFIVYILLNAIFYTASNISYAALTSLITKNSHERVQMGSYRFMAASIGSLLTASITMSIVNAFGGDALAWRNTAILYAVIGIVINTISTISVKELPETKDETTTEVAEVPQQKQSFIESLKILLHSKAYLLILMLNICTYLQTGLMGVNVYYVTYVLGNENLMGVFSMAQLLPSIIGLPFAPIIVKKLGLYKVGVQGHIVSIIAFAGFIISGYMMNVPLMVVFLFIACLAKCSLAGNLNAMIAETSDYLFKKTGKHMDGLMFSCSSVGIKVGSGIGTALLGWLLTAGGFVNGAAVQPQSCINMLNFLFLWMPAITTVLNCIMLAQMKPEKIFK